MEIKFEFHGVLRRLAGSDQRTLSVVGAQSVQDALRALEGEMPALAEVLCATACARGDQLLHAQSEIEDGDTLVLLPPVSGG